MFPRVKKGSAFREVSRKWKSADGRGLSDVQAGPGRGAAGPPEREGAPPCPGLGLSPHRIAPCCALAAQACRTPVAVTPNAGASGAAGRSSGPGCRLPVSAPWRPRGMSRQRGDRPQAPPNPRGPWLRAWPSAQPWPPRGLQDTAAGNGGPVGGAAARGFLFRFSGRTAPEAGRRGLAGARCVRIRLSPPPPRPLKARVPRRTHGDGAPRRPPRPPRGTGGEVTRHEDAREARPWSRAGALSSVA